MATGECNCGMVAFEIESDIADVYVCHCSICRKSTGAGGIAVVVVDKTKFRWLKGQENVNKWLKPDHVWETSFCTVCGSNLPGKNDDARMYVPVGTLTSGHENLKVAHHIYVDSKAVWDEIGDAGIQHTEGFQHQSPSSDTANNPLTLEDIKRGKSHQV